MKYHLEEGRQYHRSYFLLSGLLFSSQKLLLQILSEFDALNCCEAGQYHYNLVTGINSLISESYEISSLPDCTSPMTRPLDCQEPNFSGSSILLKILSVEYQVLICSSDNFRDIYALNALQWMPSLIFSAFDLTIPDDWYLKIHHCIMVVPKLFFECILSQIF